MDTAPSNAKIPRAPSGKSWQFNLRLLEKSLHPLDRFPALLLALGAMLAGLLLFISTSDSIPMVWDEGDYIRRGQLVQSRILNKDAPQNASSPPLAWPFLNVREGHPSGFIYPIALGEWLAPASWSPLTRYRYGPMICFSLAGGCLFYRLAREASSLAGIVTCLALFGQSRLFAHAHFATQDGQLVAWTLIAWAFFSPALRSWIACGFWGICLGMLLSVKFSALLVIPTFWIAVLFLWSRRAWVSIFISTAIAISTFWIFNPPLWTEPLEGLKAYFRLNLNRQENFNITGYFLGGYYDLDHPLPWYNSLFWLAIVLPLPWLILGLFGLGHWCFISIRDRKDHCFLLSALGILAVFLITRAMPGVPVHDGVRLFLPAFGVWAIFVGWGTHHFMRWSLCEFSRWKAASWLILFGTMLGGVHGAARYFPQNLSYYNLLIGGLRGATDAGMEPTYWWDGLDAEALNWLHEHTPEGEKIGFSACSVQNLQLLQEWKILQRGTLRHQPGAYRWYVVQNRPSGMNPIDQYLIANEKPAFRKYIHPPSDDWGPWKLDVPLLEVYSMEQFARAVQAIQQAKHSEKN
ncbi:Hypothetical protein PBC10988_13530 [Planctomycetales bacterium 10988]|nr:Hypothetical protein PBC10988_13530 [Planctomycetales bacterium 10988]